MLHRKLLDKINLEALASIETQLLRNEVRTALTGLVDGEQTLLSAVERNQVIGEVLDEVFGLGPLEPLLQDSTISDILVNTHSQVYIERKGAVGTHQRHLQRRLPSTAHHRQNCFAGGTQDR